MKSKYVSIESHSQISQERFEFFSLSCRVFAFHGISPNQMRKSVRIQCERKNSLIINKVPSWKTMNCKGSNHTQYAGVEPRFDSKKKLRYALVKKHCRIDLHMRTWVSIMYWMQALLRVGTCGENCTIVTKVLFFSSVIVEQLAALLVPLFTRP